MVNVPERQANIPHKTGDPDSWKTYAGQHALKRRLQLRLAAMETGAQAKALFYAPFGAGKTAFARVMANEMFRENLIDHYVESIGMNFSTKSDVDEFILALKPYTFVFIDELHTLTSGIGEGFYSAIQDNFHIPYRTTDRVRLPVGITWVGATTQLGKVNQSLQRRLIPIPLEPLTKTELADIALRQKVPVDPAAAELMAKQCYNPWEIKDELYAVSEDIAVSRSLPRITKRIVEEACGILGIDDHGLRPVERRVLQALFESPRTVKSWSWKSYSLSLSALIAITGIDRESFQNSIEPKLLHMKLLKISSFGRELTTEALSTYFGGI